MAAMAAEKLNIINVSLSLGGKYGSVKFTPATQHVASYILTKQQVLSDASFRTKCAELETILNVAHPTTCTALKSLRESVVLARSGQSEYSKAEDYAPIKMDYIPVYTFLYGFTYEDNGKRKHRTKNAIKVLCLFLRDLFNPKRDAKLRPQYFISKSGRKTAFFCSGKERIASATNLPAATVKRAIDVLLKAKLLYRGVCHYEDGKWTVSKGIGINNDYLSAYIIPNELRLKVAEIRAQDEKQKQRIAAEKELFGVDTPKQEGQQEPAEPEQPLEIGYYKKYILIIKDNFGSGAEFRELKRKFREANNLWLDT
ncbi:MAG: hypothetical protein K2L12_08520, partial [Clostridia bacterium]|nr:hypothetical protein [Clostridia bacterium]